MLESNLLTNEIVNSGIKLNSILTKTDLLAASAAFSNLIFPDKYRAYFTFCIYSALYSL